MEKTELTGKCHTPNTGFQQPHDSFFVGNSSMPSNKPIATKKITKDSGIA